MRKKNVSFKRFLSALAALVMILAAMPAMEAKAAQDVVVHFKNTLGWTTVNAYSWEADNGNNEVLGGWPGVDITETAEGEWYTATVLGHSYDNLYIIFNDGTSQTVDICLDVTQGAEWWLVPNGDDGGKVTCSAATNQSDAESGNGSQTTTPSTPSDEPETPATYATPANPTITVSPEVNGNEVTFYCEVEGASKVEVAGDFNGWACTEMSKDGNVYSYTTTLAKGSYQYKFVVDGNWYTDAVNTNTVDDGSGNINSTFEVTEDGVDAPVSGGKYTYTIYGYSSNATRNTTSAAAIWFWDKSANGEGQEIAFTETEELADGRTWLKAVVEVEVGSEVGLILKSAGEWGWQTADLVYTNTDATEVTLYLVDGHEQVYTSLDDIVIEDAADTEAEDTKSDDTNKNTDTKKDDTTTSTKKEPMSAVTIAWIVVAIVVVAAAVVAFFVVRKLTADLPKPEETADAEAVEEAKDEE